MVYNFLSEVSRNVDKWLCIYAAFKILDFLTGFLKAFKIEGFKSSKLRDGVFRTIGEIVALMFTAILDYSLNLNVLLITTEMLFIFKECISIIENLGTIGVEIPDIVKNKIYELKPTPTKDDDIKDKERE